MYLINFNGIDFIKSIGTLFTRDVSNRYRYTYGLYHPNATGNLCLLEFTLSFYIRKILDTNMNKGKKVLFYIINAVTVIMLFSTASRSSITGVLIFLLIYSFINLDGINEKINFKLDKNIFSCIKVLIMFFIIILIIITFNYADIENILYNSNRLGGFIYNIPILISENKIWTGLGFVDSALFGQNVLIYSSMTYIDNYYLYVLITTGIIGIAIVIITIIMIITKLYFTKIHCKKEKNIVLSIFLTLLYCGFFETCVIYPTFLSSFVILIICLSFIEEKSS
jgi:hypothetical protein